MRLRAEFLIFAFAACVQGPEEGAPFPVGDLARFETEVQPTLSASCANPSCHGQALRPLQVFAPFQHRLDPALLWRDLPLTQDELTRNQERALALIAGVAAAEESLLLRKPLAAEAGGMSHEGGVVFEDRSDAGWITLHGWAEAALEIDP